MTREDLIAWTEETARRDAARVTGHAPLTEKQRRYVARLKGIARPAESTPVRTVSGNVGYVWLPLLKRAVSP